MGRHSEKSDDDKPVETDSGTDALDSDDTPTRSDKADAFWEKVGVQPVEIALPKGVGLTLRAYRMSDTVEWQDDDVDDAETAEDETDDEDVKADKDDTKSTVSKKSAKSKPAKDSDEDEDEDDDSVDDEDDRDESDEDDDDRDESDEDDEDEDSEPEPEEIPIFLSSDQTLPLFETPQALVAYVKSTTDTDLAAIDTWDELVKGIRADYVVAAEDDRYELDLIVRNLREGHDAWDAELLIGAGELARDIGFALRLASVITTLAPKSPLDDLDNALRDQVDGGLRGMFGRRRARKVGAQQSALAWRGIINKISESVDWRN